MDTNTNANAKRLNVLVTGSTSGFGRSIVETLARSGHRVFATMRNVGGKNSGVARELDEWSESEGVALEVVELDVLDDSSVNAAVESILGSAGHIDVVVNNAGIGSSGYLEAFSMDQVSHIFNVNTLGPLRVNRAVLPTMRARKSGLLIHITSSTGRLYVPGLNIYSGSKYALEALVESYSCELAPFGIDCVSVEPGGYPTEIGGSCIEAADADRQAAYGEGTNPASALYAFFGEKFSGPNPPDMKEVADCVSGIIDSPAGQRPLRVVVGNVGTDGLAELNDITVKVQKEYLDSMGI